MPLASEAFGDPSRFLGVKVVVFFDGSVCFRRPDGVLVPFEDGTDSFGPPSSSALRSSAFWASVSVSSELCKRM